MEKKLITEIEELIELHLKEYLKTLYSYSIYSDEQTIYVIGKKNEDDTSDFYLLRLIIRVQYSEFLIPTMFLPIEDRKKGIGMGLISYIFKLANDKNYTLALTEMVDGFYQTMLGRGAIKTNIPDCLQITKNTNLK